MNDNTVSFVKRLSVGPCECQWNMGSFSPATYDPHTGKTDPGHYDRGPQTHHCMRCRARAALDADGVDYVKDDARGSVMSFNGNVVCAVPTAMLGDVWVGETMGHVPSEKR